MQLSKAAGIPQSGIPFSLPISLVDFSPKNSPKAKNRRRVLSANRRLRSKPKLPSPPPPKQKKKKKKNQLRHEARRERVDLPHNIRVRGAQVSRQRPAGMYIYDERGE